MYIIFIWLFFNEAIIRHNDNFTIIIINNDFPEGK